MPITTYAGTEVTVNDEGFFADPGQWREEMAPPIARRKTGNGEPAAPSERLR